MARELTPAELEELLGVYALDALDGDERAQVEVHLERSPAAQSEVAGLQEAAAMLAHSGGAAPEGLWSRIEEALGADPPRLVLPFDGQRTRASHDDRVRGTERRRHGRRPRGIGVRVALGVAAASAAAALVATVVVSGQMSEQEARLDRVATSVENDGMRRAAMGAMADPSARTVRLVAREGGPSATVVSLPGGAGFLMGHHIPRLAPGRTYQLWAMTGDAGSSGLVSAGVLGRDLDVMAFHAPPSVHGFIVTEEAEPGVLASTHKPMLAGEFA